VLLLRSTRGVFDITNDVRMVDQTLRVGPERVNGPDTTES
jgi:hypothetical protein